MTNRAAAFVGKIDLICYCWDYCVGVRVVWCGGRSLGWFVSILEV